VIEPTSEVRRDNLTDLAAALTYYGVLAIFPAIIAVVSILGLVGRSATQPLIENLGKVAPGPAKSIFTSSPLRYWYSSWRRIHMSRSLVSLRPSGTRSSIP
jgi:hypothetical protein